MAGGRTGLRAPIASALVLGLAATTPSAQAPEPGAPPGNGAGTAARPLPSVAPDFVRADLAGHPVRMRGYRGKLVLLVA